MHRTGPATWCRSGNQRLVRLEDTSPTSGLVTPSSVRHPSFQGSPLPQPRFAPSNMSIEELRDQMAQMTQLMGQLKMENEALAAAQAKNDLDNEKMIEKWSYSKPWGANTSPSILNLFLANYQKSSVHLTYQSSRPRTTPVIIY